MISNKKTPAALSNLLIIGLTLLLNTNVVHAEVATKNSIETIYNESCAVCHDIGALHAPKTGDKVLWRKLEAQKGLPQLVKSVKDGLSQMPAGGLCSDCSDADYEALIKFMAE